MSSVVGVHGIAQEQLGRPDLQTKWSIALADGVEIARGRSVAVPSLDIGFYGDLFLSRAAGGTPVVVGGKGGADVPELGSLSQWDLQFIESAADEIAELMPEDASADKGFGEVPAVLRPVASRLARRLDGWRLLAFVGALRQVRVYLDEDDLAEAIRARVIGAVGAGCSVLIGHSLGSVVAFETVALHPELPVGALVTVGSPLSMRTVASRLRTVGPESGGPLPGRVRRWVNIYDPADPVAAAGPVSRLWADASDFTVDNGNEPHSITRYLAKRITGETISAVVRSATARD